MAARIDHINLRQVEIFRATMKFGTVTAAAAALGSSQPTITRELARLESHLGFSLFERKRQRLVPTARAIKLYQEVQASFIGLDRINGFVERLREASEEVLTVASLPAFAQTILPEAVARLAVAHPGLTLNISTVDPRNQSSISGFDFDLGLIEDIYTQRDAEVIVLGVYDLVAVVPAQHALAARDHLEPQDFEGASFISLGPNDPYRLAVERIFDQVGTKRRLLLSSQSASSVCELVSRGLGVSIVNPLTALSYESAAVLLKRFSPRQQFVVSALRPLNRPSVATSDHLTNLLRAVCAEKEALFLRRGLALPKEDDRAEQPELPVW
ncbi:LysR family transcriptional regulator [Pseudaminobacter soli (ex Li et al. 2025)]|uniref:LysR family transcriptional regulator n=1 Tax=Pseudaminobacter soli (ex Li et al. 2025) TaxID=1295366 RepID=A0A2P7S1W3_9HYPH|nr:LysR family transcriptional regulator [Mesorhizobium soli]PSJ56426.1 LysR family transcriptional regulator [Mesorhizobium soli]